MEKEIPPESLAYSNEAKELLKNLLIPKAFLEAP